MNKIAMTGMGIQPATFWLVVQSFNQLHHYVPQFVQGIVLYARL
jgi:hypothetical protein